MSDPRYIASLLETQRQLDALTEDARKVRRRLEEQKRTLVNNVVLKEVPYSFLAGEYLVTVQDRFDSWGDRIVTLDKVKETS